MRKASLHPKLCPILAQYSSQQWSDIFESAETLSTGKKQIVKAFSHEGKNYILKKYSELGLLSSLRLLLNFSRADNAFTFAQTLQANQIGCPDHLLVLKNIHINTSNTYLLMARAPGTPLFDFIQKDTSLTLSRQAVINLTNMIRKLQSLGIAHGDLHTRNFIINHDDSVQLIDLDNARFSRKRCKKDTKRLVEALKKNTNITQPLLDSLAGNKKASNNALPA